MRLHTWNTFTIGLFFLMSQINVKKLPKAAITCVRQIDRRLSVIKSLNKEIVGSITCTPLLSVNGQVSVSFCLSERFLTDDGQVTHRFLLKLIYNLKFR